MQSVSPWLFKSALEVDMMSLSRFPRSCRPVVVRFSVLLVCACLGLLSLIPSRSAMAAWSIITINPSSPIDEGMYPSAAVDSNGYLRIAFLRTSSYDLIYYYRNWLGGWIETAVSTNNVGQYCSMALDSSDNPYVCYYNDTNNALDYAWRNGTWSNQVITISTAVNSTSIDLDSSDRPHIAYTASGDSNQYYKWLDGVIWQPTTISTTADTVTDCSLALDSGDRPHIAYRFVDGSDAGVRYSHHDGSSWDHDTVDQANIFCGMDPSLALDSSDRPHISYAAEDLKRAWHDGSDWHTAVVEDLSHPEICLFTSLALDDKDRPHIAYIVYNSTSDQSHLKYTWYDGSTWHPETVETMAGQAPCSISLILGASSYIAYYDPNVTNGSLKYATYNHPPIADAGPDQYVVDTSSGGWGVEPVTLDGTDSYDPDGMLTAYSWKEGETEIATSSTPVVNLAVGSHTINLVVTDNNSTGSPGDEVEVEVVSPTAAVFRVDTSGRMFSDATVYAAAFETGEADIAEWVSVSGVVDPGDVLELDPRRTATYRRSNRPCSLLVAGVVSTAPGVVLGSPPTTPHSLLTTYNSQALLALIGIVPVQVTAEGGPIRPGDLLVTSSTPGHAMRWSGTEPCPCSLVGKALEPMTEESGVILVLLTAH